MDMKTFSFFSYKGGAGRSTLAFNTIPLLASEHIKPTKDTPMIVVDMDLDSCGMSYLLGADKLITNENCVQKMLRDPFDIGRFPSASEHPLFKNMIPVGNAYGYPENEAILLLPAKDGAPINPSSQSNYGGSDGFYSAQMDRFLGVCLEHDISAVVFDSSVGHNATANISNEAADTIVCCMRPTTQFTNGTHRFLLDAENKYTSGKNIVLVPNVIPTRDMVINGNRYPSTAVVHIRSMFESIGDHSAFNYVTDMLDSDEFGIPMVERFMWREEILALQDESTLSDGEKVALSRYKKLARILFEQ